MNIKWKWNQIVKSLTLKFLKKPLNRIQKQRFRWEMTITFSNHDWIKRLVTPGMQNLAFSGLRSVLARISLFATGDRYSLRKAKRCIPKTLYTIPHICSPEIDEMERCQFLKSKLISQANENWADQKAQNIEEMKIYKALKFNNIIWR